MPLKQKPPTGQVRSSGMSLAFAPPEMQKEKDLVIEVHHSGIESHFPNEADWNPSGKHVETTSDYF